MEQRFGEVTLFAFICNANTVSEINYPKETTKVTPLFDKEVYVECENNFTENERQIIQSFRIISVKQLTQHTGFTRQDKTRCLECYKFVKTTFEETGEEPPNGHNTIQIGDIFVLVRISKTGLIKYVKPAADPSDCVRITLKRKNL
jgi:hypothetical protein